MSDLRTAAQQALEALEYHVEQTRPIWKTSEAIAALEAALVEDAMQKFTDVNQELEAALAEPVVNQQLTTEPVQEPVAVALHTGTKQGIKWYREIEHGTPLYTSPPQRKPLVDPAEYDDAGAAERYNRGLK